MKIIIAGGRDFNDFEKLNKECITIIKEQLKPKTRSEIEIVSGTANGADKLGEQFAEKYKIKVKQFAANWNLYGKSAGYKRNEQMAVYAKEDKGVLIAFWDGKSRGTKHMIELAEKHELEVFVVLY